VKHDYVSHVVSWSEYRPDSGNPPKWEAKSQQGPDICSRCGFILGDPVVRIDIPKTGMNVSSVRCTP
jgi:hypothetical protein